MTDAITLSTQCWTIHTGSLIEGTLADHSKHIETTTRPTGVGYKYYVTTTVADVDRDTEQRDAEGYAITETVRAEMWALAVWATWGGPERIVSTYDTEAEAHAAAEATYVQDILNNPDYLVFLDKETAQKALAEAMNDADQ